MIVLDETELVLGNSWLFCVELGRNWSDCAKVSWYQHQNFRILEILDSLKAQSWIFSSLSRISKLEWEPEICFGETWETVDWFEEFTSTFLHSWILEHLHAFLCENSRNFLGIWGLKPIRTTSVIFQLLKLALPCSSLAAILDSNLNHKPIVPATKISSFNARNHT